MEPSRLKSDVTDRVLLDVYRQSVAASQAVQKAAQSTGKQLDSAAVSKVWAQYLANYAYQPGAQPGTAAPTEYMPAGNDAATRQTLETDVANAPRQQANGFQFTQPMPQQETNGQYRQRYMDAYNRAYAEYEANGSRMPFKQWKAQFDAAFTAGRVQPPTGAVTNQVSSQNQPQGTYRLVEDSMGNVQIVQTDGRVYSYIPYDQVQYQLPYIKQMTGKAPLTKPAAQQKSGGAPGTATL
ncbi:MAG: hypothetical protein JSS66_07980 [Armatimonadetes bacterium]|nr:hypothetical protein [Armatimonadota bacterium]